MTREERVWAVAQELKKYASAYYWHGETSDPDPSFEAAEAAIAAYEATLEVTEEEIDADEDARQQYRILSDSIKYGLF